MAAQADSRSNLQELVCPAGDARALAAVAQELQNQGHAQVAAGLLGGTLVRFKKRGQYHLARVASLRLPPEVAQPTLALEGYADIAVNQLSGTNPFIDDATYEASGQQEAARLATSAAAAGGLDLWQSAAAVWRRKVALGWAPQLQQLVTMHGIGLLLQDLQDQAMIEAVAENLEALPPAAPAAPAAQPPAQHQPVHMQQQHMGPQGPLPVAQPGPQPPVQQAVAVHDPDDLPPHLRPQQQQLVVQLPAQQPAQQPRLPAQQQAALQRVEQQWAHQLWPVVQRQPLPPPASADERQRREAEEGAETPVLGDLSEAAAAAWDAAMATEAESPAEQQPSAAQKAEDQVAAPLQQPVAQLEKAAAQQQAEQQMPSAAAEQPVAQLEEAQSLLLQLLEQQQSQQQQQEPPPPPPEQQPAEAQQRAAGPQPTHQQPLKEEPLQHAEPSAEQQQVKQEPVYGQLPLPAEPHAPEQSAEQQTQPLPRSISEPPQRWAPGDVGASPPLLRSISELPFVPQLPPGLQQHEKPHAQQLRLRHQQPQQSQQQQQQPQPQQPQEWSILVANLGDAFTAEQLEQYFRQRYPSVTSAAVPRLERTGEPKGFGFVRFARREEQLRAAKEMDGHVLPGGRKIGTGLAGMGGGPPPPAQPAVPAALPAMQQAAPRAAAVQQEKADSPVQRTQQPQQPQQAQQVQQPQPPQQQQQQPQEKQGELLRQSSSRDKSPPALNGVPTAAGPAGPAGAAAGPAQPTLGPAPPAAAALAALPGPLGRQPSFPAGAAAAVAPQAMLPMLWPAGMLGAAGLMPFLMQQARLCYPGMRPGMPGMPAAGMLGPGMAPGMGMGGFGMPAGGSRGPGSMAARPPPPLPPPAKPLHHLGSGHSSAETVNLEAAGQQQNGAEAACKSVAFDQGLPFPASHLLAELDTLRGERDCVYRAGCNLRHVCDFLMFTGTADIELRPEGPLVVRLHQR